MKRVAFMFLCLFLLCGCSKVPVEEKFLRRGTIGFTSKGDISTENVVVVVRVGEIERILNANGSETSHVKILEISGGGYSIQQSIREELPLFISPAEICWENWTAVPTINLNISPEDFRKLMKDQKEAK